MDYKCLINECIIRVVLNLLIYNIVHAICLTFKIQFKFCIRVSHYA